jgi:Cd2+/Zn2+-exporting ATPase
MGVSRMIMISGDHQKVAEAIARDVGIDEAWGDLMPEDKVAAIKKLAGEDKVAMVGDGVNDAPAMASATVGIAMGAAGSDVALETADVALMADDLAHLPFAVGLSRHTRGSSGRTSSSAWASSASSCRLPSSASASGPRWRFMRDRRCSSSSTLRLLAYRDPTGRAG